MEEAFEMTKSEGVSECNVQKMANAVQEATKAKFKKSFEAIVAHSDFVAKINFAGDLNCKIEVDGKFILAYATPNANDKEVNIIDANSFFNGEADEIFDANGNDTKPTYIVYGPIR
ncbi:hypothetical protein WR25_05786 [Diploscapter pachys]|uniref:Ground-like domain-containing protein n=1 Tax=Diploscapter pachys TaxID=2018661 RepID=A0A2A2K5E3_9BILA|nr:hypothetical protein WR25_05786 [Diploscapter pachys]